LAKSKKVFTLNDKYKYYEKSVQNTEGELEIINGIFQELRGKAPITLREDFCGTAKLACEWTTLSTKHTAFGIDLDPEPVAYGKENHYSKLTPSQKKRMEYVMGNVLDNYTKRKADLVVAFNFSYFIFKKRAELVNYFSHVRKGLNKDGVFLLDLFGGPECQTEVEEETEYSNYSYYWDCKKFNPIRSECLYAIHFKPKGMKKQKDVFTYDWRMWTMMEVREILIDAGFSKTYGYWEGDDEDGGGDGNFFKAEDAESCEAWVTYIAALP
jgi:SAM-dependent methyltransferase